MRTTYIPRRRPLELDQVVICAVGGEEGTSMLKSLKVLALRIALQRLVARLEEMWVMVRTE